MPNLNDLPSNPVQGQTHTLANGIIYVATSIDPDIWQVQSLQASVLGNDTVGSANITDGTVRGTTANSSGTQREVLQGSIHTPDLANDAVSITKLNALQATTVADDAGKVLTVNSTGMGIEWSDNPSSFTAGGLPGILNIKAEENTTTQTGTFVPSGDFIMVTGCGAGGTGTSVTSDPGTARGPGGGSGGGVFQAKVYVTAGATYDVSVPGRVESPGGANLAGQDGGDTTITLRGSSVILTLGGGGGSGINVTGSAGSGGTVTATEGTTTGTIDPGAITIQGVGGRPGGTDSQRGRHWGGTGIFGNRDTYTSGASGTDNAAEFTGNQFGRGSDGTRASARNSVGGFITILF